jgi:class 3 adenylate cyclase
LTSPSGDGVIRAPPVSREGGALLKLPDRIGSLARLWRRETMTEGKPVERRLAAIVAADVVGYSRLMGADEVGTLRALRAHRRELIDPAIAAHRGRIVKTTGDGLLVEFPSAVEAVACGISVQRGIALRNGGLAGDKRLTFRIGINVGDIISEAGDIFGDGVNVAARLKACANRAVCASPARCATRSGTSCRSPSMISASNK